MEIVGKNLTYTYGEGTPFERKALSNVNFRIPSGSLTGIIGHTGSGKSTLIQHFNGLLRPTSGYLRIGDRIVTASSKRLGELRKRVGMVFQYPEHQLFEETVAQDVAFGPRHLNLPEEEVNERVRTALAHVGLNDEKIREKSPFQLSGGQMRRVAIAGVLAMEPQVLVLDEPTAGLDPRSKENILRLITEFKQRRSLTVVLVSHNMEDVARITDHLLVLHQGTVVLQGSPLSIFQQESELKAYGLDMPHVFRFVKELNRFVNPRMEYDLYTEEELAHEIASRWHERTD